MRRKVARPMVGDQTPQRGPWDAYTMDRSTCARIGCTRPSEGFAAVIRPNLPGDHHISPTGHLWFAPVCTHCSRVNHLRDPTPLAWITEQYQGLTLARAMRCQEADLEKVLRECTNMLR